MRAVAQRVTEAAVRVHDREVSRIGAGLLVLVGVTHTDTAAQARALAHKLYTLRVLPGERSVQEAGGGLLVVSQFTLYADVRKGRRPSWNAAAPASVAEPLVDEVVAALRNLGADVAAGEFGADMRVSLVNDGPVTLVLDL